MYNNLLGRYRIGNSILIIPFIYRDSLENATTKKVSEMIPFIFCI